MTVRLSRRDTLLRTAAVAAAGAVRAAKRTQVERHAEQRRPDHAAPEAHERVQAERRAAQLGRHGADQACIVRLAEFLDRDDAGENIGFVLRDPSLEIFSGGSVLAQSGNLADTVYYNGSILTMAGNKPAYVDALAVKDGKIAFAGNKDEALRMKGDATKVVDLDGKALLPGFIDAHSHYINSLLVANQAKLYAPPSGPGKDVPSIIAELKRYAAERQIPKGEMIMGYGYDDTVMPNGRLLNRDDLDLAFPDNPVRVDHVSMHGTVLNSLALKKYGIGAATQTPPGGVIVRKPGSNEPYGLIMETAFLPVVEKAEPMTAQQEVDWSRAGQMLYAEAGITTAQEGATHLPQLETIKRASEAGVMSG